MKRIPATTENVKSWEDIPLVKLDKILKQMVWFNDYLILSEFNNEKIRSNYEKYNTTPDNLTLTMNYRKESIIIKCLWEKREAPYYSDVKYYDRFAIGVEYPFDNRFQTQRYWVNNQTIFKHTRFYSVAINEIEDSILEAQECIDEQITEEENEKKQEIELEIIKKNLCENLDINITKERYGNGAFTYREDFEYNLKFGSIDNRADLFQILEIGGVYTQDEIKKMIEIIGGNPRAITERLTK